MPGIDDFHAFTSTSSGSSQSSGGGGGCSIFYFGIGNPRNPMGHWQTIGLRKGRIDMFEIALPSLIGCLMIAGGIALLSPLAMIALAFGILKACI